MLKQVRVTTHPAPLKLSESRLVLKALQKFGEVVTFLNSPVSGYFLSFVREFLMTNLEDLNACLYVE
jgi:hypothetical protein